MKFDAFEKILRYSKSDKIMQLENYITEIFVFILNYLKQSNSLMFYKILELFGVPKNAKNISIDTQLQENDCRPDIYIKHDSKITLIEVKINSQLNEYQLKKKRINQYEKYSNGYNASIFLLTKYVIFEKNIPDKNKKLWTEIIEIFDEFGDDYVINCFKHILEENGMANTKVDEKKLTAIGSIINLDKLIKNSWRYREKYSLSPIAFNKQGDDFWLRYFVRDKKKKKNILYIGTRGEDKEMLYVYLDQAPDNIKRFKNILGILCKDDPNLVGELWFKDLFKLDAKQQKIKIETLFKKIMEDTLKLK